MREGLILTIEAKNLDFAKKVLKVINNQVFCQSGFFSDYDEELLDALLGDNWINEYPIGEKYIEV